MYEFFILKILLAIVIVTYSVHLLYVRHNPSLAERKLRKYDVDTREHDLRKKIYTPQFLAIALATALIFVLSLTLDILRLTQGPVSFSLKVIVFAVSIIFSFIGIYLLHVLFKKK